MNRWLHKFMEKPDISDRFDSNVNLSALSVHPRGLLDKKMENMHGGGPDKPDIFTLGSNLSGLSGLTPGLLEEKLINTPEPNISNRLDPNWDLSDGLQDVLEKIFSPYADHDFQERLAIAEYDGEQTPLQAQRIAYLDAFISILTALPATTFQRDWLDMRIQTALAWIEDQECRTIN